jgi:putative transposase
MKRSKFTEEQIVGILREQEAGEKTADVCRRHGVSSATFYAWKAKYGGMEVSDAKRLRALEEENGKLKRLLAEAMLDNTALNDVTKECLAAVVDTSISGRRVARELTSLLTRRGRPALIVSDHRVHLERHARMDTEDRDRLALHRPWKAATERHLRGVQRPDAGRALERDPVLRPRSRPRRRRPLGGRL